MHPAVLFCRNGTGTAGMQTGMHPEAAIPVPFRVASRTAEAKEGSAIPAAQFLLVSNRIKDIKNKVKSLEHKKFYYK